MSRLQMSGRSSWMWRTRSSGPRMVEAGPALEGSSGSCSKRAPGPVVRLIRTSVPLERMRSTTSRSSAPSMLGLVVFGLRTWICTTAAPALAASTQELAICSGVTGTAGFFPGECADPVTAHEMITLRCMAVTLPGLGQGPHKARSRAS